ncbi:MAG: hypothetical protein MZU95_15505 [Desulfomicrobium escambiense]|nr:hypothetical protein [Desulfomicrobium escambiense]
MKKSADGDGFLGQARWTGSSPSSTATSTPPTRVRRYNSYVIEEGKTVLIDTVWKPFAKEFVDNLEAEGHPGQAGRRHRPARGDRPLRGPARAAAPQPGPARLLHAPTASSR